MCDTVVVYTIKSNALADHRNPEKDKTENQHSLQAEFHGSWDWPEGCNEQHQFVLVSENVSRLNKHWITWAEMFYRRNLHFTDSHCMILKTDMMVHSKYTARSSQAVFFKSLYFELCFSRCEIQAIHSIHVTHIHVFPLMNWCSVSLWASSVTSQSLQCESSSSRTACLTKRSLKYFPLLSKTTEDHKEFMGREPWKPQA